MKKSIILIIMSIMGTISADAQENFETKSLSIFKNGQSFIVKEGTVNVADKKYKMTELPQALFGTFWFTDENKSIVGVTSKVDNHTEKKERKASNLIELFHANKGKTVTVSTTDNKILSGVVEDFDLPEELNIYEHNDPVLMLKMDNKWISLKPEYIQSIEFSEKPNRVTTVKNTVQKPIITVHFKKDGAQKMSMMYLQNGLTWVPVYKLELLSETSARLMLQAEVTNGVEDIKNANIDFVVGVPTFSAANAPATLLNLNSAVPLPQPRNSYSNAKLYSNAVMADYSEISAEESGFGAGMNIETSANEDLYFYSAKGVTLQKGSAANIPLMDKEIKIKHLYKCNIPVSAFQNFRASSLLDNYNDDENSVNSVGEKRSDVFHYIQITNNTEFPLTSGPTMVVQKDTKKAIAQNTLLFTAKGSTSPLLITNSPDVEVKETEKITETKLNAKKMNGYEYALVTIKGTITINNTKSKEIEMEVSRLVSGKVISATENHKTTITTNTGDINKSQKISFNSKIKANSKHTIEYVYQMYSRQLN